MSSSESIAINANNKRNRQNETLSGQSKKPREVETPSSSITTIITTSTTKRRLADEGDWTYDSDSDYDDLDDMVTASDIEHFHFNDDDLDDLDDEDDRSTASTRTTVSTGSVGSNTPSLVGENLESFTLGETATKEKKQVVGSGPLLRSPLPPLRRSVFPNIPPFIRFFHHNEVSEISLPAELRKQLRWKLSSITPAVVKRVVTNSGFRLMKKTCTEWGGTWGNHMKSVMFKDVAETSKINHFPGTFNIGRKDRLWKNYHQLKLKFGKDEFSFLPRTFCLPQESKLLRKVWEKRGGREKWIVKPPALSRGNGIRVVHKWSEVPKIRPLIVQKYIAKPHLINDTKYDLRIYVLVTGIHPLKIYLFEDGLVRFASNKYDPDPKSLNDVYMHLTNYSINKNSSSYCHNEDSEARQGHKWTLASLWSYFRENSIDCEIVWSRIKDLVIKTVISAEEQMYKAIRANVSSHYSSYELFGFDVLLDSKFKPWLIEVNISPSLHSASPLDLEVKSALTTEIFNIAGFQIPAKMTQKSQKAVLDKLDLGDVSGLCLDKRLYVKEMSKSDRAKQDAILASLTATTTSNAECLDDASLRREILETLTPDDVRFLVRSEEEMTQIQRFQRIFPTKDTSKYFKFFKHPRYYNLLLDAWEREYCENRNAAIQRLTKLCRDKVHLKVPASVINSKIKKKKNIVNVSMLKAPTGDPTTSSVKDEQTSNTDPPSSDRRRPSSTSPEPMSTGGDSEAERSRSPSPHH